MLGDNTLFIKLGGPKERGWGIHLFLFCFDIHLFVESSVERFKQD